MHNVSTPEENIVINSNEEIKVALFGITSMSTTFSPQTVLFVMKMNKAIEKQGLAVTIHMYSASQIDEHGSAADIILLSPELYFQEKMIKEAFSERVVKLISKKAYGLLEVDKLLQELFTAN